MCVCVCVCVCVCFREGEKRVWTRNLRRQRRRRRSTRLRPRQELGESTTRGRFVMNFDRDIDENLRGVNFCYRYNTSRQRSCPAKSAYLSSRRMCYNIQEYIRTFGYNYFDGPRSQPRFSYNQHSSAYCHTPDI